MPQPPSDSSNKITDAFEEEARLERTLQRTLNASIAAHAKETSVREQQVAERAKAKAAKAAPSSRTSGSLGTSSGSAWAPTLSGSAGQAKPPPYKSPPSEWVPPTGSSASGLTDMPPPQKACPASDRLPGPAGSAPSARPLGTARVVELVSGKAGLDRQSTSRVRSWAGSSRAPPLLRLLARGSWHLSGARVSPTRWWNVGTRTARSLTSLGPRSLSSLTTRQTCR